MGLPLAQAFALFAQAARRRGAEFGGPTYAEREMIRALQTP